MSLESTDIKRKRLKFRSWHRGTKEMDLLLGTFADEHLPRFNEQELEQYEHVLTYNDPDLYNWITGKESPDDDMPDNIFELLSQHRYKPQ